MIHYYLTDALQLNGTVNGNEVVVHLSNGKDLVAKCNKFNFETSSDSERWTIDGRLHISNQDNVRGALCAYITELFTGKRVVFRSKGANTDADAQDEKEAAEAGLEVIYAYPEDAHALFSDGERIGVGKNRFTLSNGKTIDTAMALRDGNVFYVVDSQWFSRLSYAHEYFRRRVIELLTGVRVLLHKKFTPPDICGFEGRACSAEGECNRAICSYCPIAEKFFAEKDGVSIIYAI